MVLRYIAMVADADISRRKQKMQLHKAKNSELLKKYLALACKSFKLFCKITYKSIITINF